MSKTKWNKGRNCVLARDFDVLKTGDKAWIFDVTDDAVVLLSKTAKDVDSSRALKKVTMTHDEADECVKLTIGKPRSNFNDVLVSESDLKELLDKKLEQL